MSSINKADLPGVAPTYSASLYAQTGSANAPPTPVSCSPSEPVVYADLQPSGVISSLPETFRTVSTPSGQDRLGP
jgi:hypothetical protein